MKYSLNLFRIEDLEFACDIQIPDILLQTASFSLAGNLVAKETIAAADRLKKYKKRIILCWDILSNDAELISLIADFAKIQHFVDEVRFVDPGVGEALREIYPDIKLQFSFEHGQVNTSAVFAWSEVFKPNLTRVVLSNQMILADVSLLKGLSVPYEMKGIGPILLFYSKRKLIHPFFNEIDGYIATTVASQDRPNQVSRVNETSHGTTVFNDAELYVVDQWTQLDSAGVSFIGIELRKTVEYQQLRSLFCSPGWEEAFRHIFPNELTEGFLYKNETQSSLSVLTNSFIQNASESKIGFVLESTKNSHCVISFLEPLMMPLRVWFISPEGKNISHEISYLTDLSGQKKYQETEPGVYLIPWVKHVVPGTILTRV